MRLLLLGGSFNPVHVGHLVMAQETMQEFGYHKVLLVPSLRPPHKPDATDPGPDHRLEMLRLAIGDDPSLIIDDCELRRGGTSYTIDTVRELSAKYAVEGKLGLLLGDDLIPGFGKWKDPDLLAAEVDIVCARRLSFEKLPFPWRHLYATNPIVAISSSTIRQRVESGHGFRRLVPETVYRYIVGNRLYACS